MPAHDRAGDRDSRSLRRCARPSPSRPGRSRGAPPASPARSAPLDGEHGTLERIERREADAERGVVRERDARGALPLEERDEVGRARPDQRVDAHVPLGIERGQVRAQPRAARLDGERPRPAPSRRARRASRGRRCRSRSARAPRRRRMRAAPRRPRAAPCRRCDGGSARSARCRSGRAHGSTPRSARRRSCPDGRRPLRSAISNGAVAGDGDSSRLSWACMADDTSSKRAPAIAAGLDCGQWRVMPSPLTVLPGPTRPASSHSPDPPS